MHGYLTKKEAAAYLNVHPETIRRWAKQGKLAVYRSGRIVRFKQEDLDQVFAAQSPLQADSRKQGR
jgi:excisionase family DNA binding protein